MRIYYATRDSMVIEAAGGRGLYGFDTIVFRLSADWPTISFDGETGRHQGDEHQTSGIGNGINLKWIGLTR
jgi:hypothetical protein